MMRKLFLLSLLLLAPTAAHADWMQASSDHFVVYGNTSDKSLQRFSEQLERFHSAMAKVTGRTSAVPSPSNRVTVYIVGSEAEVQKLYGGANNRYVGGFYLPRAGASVAIVQRINGGTDGRLDFSMITLLHEYAHHFLISSSAFPSPRWMGEGAAEFFASASFENDGSVNIGRAALHRAGELFFAKDVTVTDLLDPDEYAKRRGKSTTYDAFYGKSWLLYHYLIFSKTRGGQLQKYVAGLVKGLSSREAGLAAFGDFKMLEKELDTYLNSKMFQLRIPPKDITTGKVTVRPLRAGEAAIMPVVIRSRRGVDAALAAQVLTDARTIAAKYPDDPAVQSALAEAEHDAGHDAEAIAAADKAIAADPAQVNAYVQKGITLYRMAMKSHDPKAFRAARAPFIALNAIENDHPYPLIYYYLTMKAQGGPLPALAVQGLEYALELAPFDLSLRMMVARQELHDKHYAVARANLVPVAYSPHGGRMAEMARSYIDRIDKNPDWDGSDITDDVADDAAKKGD